MKLSSWAGPVPYAPHALALAAALWTFSVAPPAFADTNEALALKAFEDGRRLFEARRYDDARMAFQTSLDAMPSPNTRLYIARCLRETGKIASAYSTFRIVSREAEDRVLATGDKRYVATQKSAALEAERLAPRVPHIVFRLDRTPGTRPADLERAVVSIDGAVVPRSELGATLDLDPGPHAIDLSGPHVRRWHVSISLAPGDTKTIALPVDRIVGVLSPGPVTPCPVPATCARAGPP